ncbi:CUB and zona pellucida-like domain-containing protein 1 [Megalops cyprinoides]|uniref:CUB and zona pellucida-like domain-containing protein 1 n=1 Tax=Megalops cyprinoides TaxID=118141 RepID=UPI00186406A9|nr:CUB and zona pellucida-like domain-containing protein 1 [Megalops cyprinoides]
MTFMITFPFVLLQSASQGRGDTNVVCTESTMTVEVRKSVIGLYEDHLRLNDPACTLISNSTHVVATMSLNSCGTELEEDEDHLIFKNEITTFDKPNQVITREHGVEIGFSCVYPKKGTVSLEFRAHRIPYVFTERGFGKFTYQFEFFHSNLFNRMVDPSTYPVEVALKEMIYMEIISSSSLPNTLMFVESCRATPIDDPSYHVFYRIIENGCVVDDTVQVYPGNSSEYRFGMEAFAFIGMHQEVFISCSVILCQAGGVSTRCSQGCTNASAGHHHHRRSAGVQTSRHYISRGPLRLTRSSAIDGTSMNLNMNLVVCVGALLAAIAMVCGVMVWKAKHSKVKYQVLPGNDF